MTAPFYQLMLVTHRQQIPLDDYLQFVKVCAESGITAVQLREKEASLDFLFHFATALQKVLQPLQIPLIINDHVHLALAVDAAGVHLGNEDMMVLKARQQLGSEKIIGLSLESEDDLFTANQHEITYVAASAVFPTQNKTNIDRHWGIDGVDWLAKRSRHPLIGIGGIDASNIQDVMNVGAKGAAVIGAIHNAFDPVTAIKTLRTLQI